MNKILLSFIFAMLCVSTFGITDVQASSFTLNTRDFLQSERPGFDTTYSQIDTSSPVFKTRFLKSTESGCASANELVDDDTFVSNSKNIAISKIKAGLINSVGSKTNLSVTNSERVVPFSRNDNECNVQYVHEATIDSSPLKNLSEGLYTFEVCVDDVCTQVSNVRLKNPTYFDVAYYPNYPSLMEHDFSRSDTRVNVKSPNIKLPGEPGLSTVMFKRYIGQENNYSQMNSFNAIPATAGGNSPSTRYPSYWELQSNLQGAGSVDNYFPNITEELKGYKDGTYKILTCLNEGHINYFNSYIKSLPRNTDIFCGQIYLKIKNSSGNKTPGGAVIPYELVNNPNEVLDTLHVPDSPYYTYTRDLTLGSTGEDVSNLQWFLYVKRMLALPPTGYFGPLTKQALIDYQKSKSIDPTGYFGPITRTSVMSDSYTDSIMIFRGVTPENPVDTDLYTVTAKTEGSGSGTVSGAGTFVRNSLKLITATPDSDSLFTAWIGGKCAGKTSACAITVDSNSTETAVFTKKGEETSGYATLTVTTEGTGSGVVSGSVGSVSSSGSRTFMKNTSIGLFATPNSDSTFSGWSGGKCAGIQSPSCSFKLIGNSTETALFTKKEVTPTTSTGLPTYTISATREGTGSGTISGTGIFEKNSRINLLATPNSDSTFTGWVGGKCARGTATTCSITVDGNSTEKAVFTKKELVPGISTPPTIPNPPATSQNYTLTVTTEGTGSGVVSGSVGSVSSSGSKTFAKNTFVGLYATPNNDSTFSRWSGGKCAGIQSPSCAFTIIGNSTEKAVFTKKEVTPPPSTVLPSYLISTTKEGTGSGTVSGSGTFEKNSRISLIATPSNDSLFTAWRGGKCGGTNSPTCVITIDGNSTEKAVFTKKEVVPSTSVVLPPNTSLPSYTVTATKGGTGSGTVSGAGTFQKYSVTTLIATPDSESVFTRWIGNKCAISTSPTCAIMVDGNTTETAVFTKKGEETTTHATVTVKTGGTGSGVVSGSVGSVSSSGSRTFMKNTSIGLFATPNSDSTFSGWSGGKCEESQFQGCSFTLIGNTTETAVFTKKDSPLSVSDVLKTAQPSSNSNIYFAVDLEIGMAHPSVITLQKYLNSNGYVINTNQGEDGSIGHETNYFGEKTKQALIKFQKDKGISPAQGFFGPQTRKAMGM